MLRVALSIAKVRDSPDAIFITAKLLISIFVQNYAFTIMIVTLKPNDFLTFDLLVFRDDAAWRERKIKIN